MNPTTVKLLCEVVSWSTLGLILACPAVLALRGKPLRACFWGATLSFALGFLLLGLIVPAVLARLTHSKDVWSHFPDGPSAFVGPVVSPLFGLFCVAVISVIRDLAHAGSRFIARSTAAAVAPNPLGPTLPEHPIILFDGVCNLCAWSVRFIIERDPGGHFHFASLQSDFGRALMVAHGLDPDELNSFILVEGGRAYTASDAALRVARRLPWPWCWCFVFIALPRFLRDPAYRFIARNRYRWFGKSDSCLIPTPELKHRFRDA